MSQKQLEHLTLTVPVTDLQHAVGTIANLADLRDSLRVDRLDVEIQIGSLPIAGQNTLGEILAKLDSIQKGESTQMAELDDKIAALQADVAEESTVEQSAVKLINGIPALIAEAVAKAQAAGATPTQLQALTDLGTTLTTNATTLGAAVTANTLAAPPAPAVP
jgi:hypothetical protein